MYKRVVGVIWAVFFHWPGVTGQVPFYEHYTQDDGLIGETGVFDIYQSHDKHLWIATNNGLSRYDGLEFVNYRRGLESTILLRVGEDDLGNIWVLSFLGDLYRVQESGFEPYPYNSVIRPHTVRGKCTSFHIDTNGTLYAATRDRFIKVDQEGRIDYTIENHGGLNGVALVEVGGTAPLALTLKDSNSVKTYVYWLDQDGSVIQKFQVDLDLSYGGHSTVEYSENDDMALLKINGTVLLLDGQDLVMRHDFPYRPMHAYLDANNHIWLGHPDDFSGATYRYSYSDGKIFRVSTLFQNRPAISFLHDHEDGIWIGTMNNGLYYMPRPNIMQYSIENEYWPNDYLKDILSTNDSLILATYAGQLGTLKDGILNLENKDKKGKGTFGKNIMDLAHGEHGEAYAIFDYEVVKIDKGKTVPVKGHLRERIVSMSQSRYDGKLWLLSSKKVGVLKNDSINWLYDAPSTQVTNAHVDEVGTLRLLGFDGLWQLEGDGFVNLGAKHPEFSKAIAHILLHNGSLWVLGAAGLFIYENGQLTNMEQKLGLLNNSVKWMVALNNNIWLNTESGLKCIDVEQRALKEVATIKGLTQTPLDFLGVHKQRLVLARNDKLTLLGPDELTPDTLIPPVFIEGIAINESDTALLPAYELAHNQNLLEIQLGFVSFRNAEDVAFEFRLDGLDEKWRASPGLQIRYNSLAPGEYRFRLRALNASGTRAAGETTFSFTISPPFWTRWWFISSALALAVFAVWFISRRRLKIALRKQEVDKRITELESSALKAQMNPHFIFNVLSSVQAYILNNDADQANNYLGQFARLIRKTLHNSRSNMVSLANELEALEHYLRLEQMRFDQSFSFSVHCDKSISPDVLLIPPMLIQPYVENAVIHGMSNADNHGQIKITISKKGEQLICEVLDNGPGIDSSGNKEKDNHESIGMMVTRQRLKLLAEGKMPRADVSVTSLSEGSKALTGTAVKITIPILKPSLN